MRNDVDERAMREFLTRFVSEMPISASAPSSALRRARRRLVMTGVAGAMIAAVAVTGIVAGFRIVNTARTTPATQPPSHVISDLHSPTTIPNGASLDFDAAKIPVADVTWRNGSLQPGPGVWFSSLPEDTVPFDGSKDVTNALSHDRFAPFDLNPIQLQSEPVVGIYTSEGRYVQARITPRPDGELNIQWVAGPPTGGATPCNIWGLTRTGGTDAAGATVVTEGAITLCNSSPADLDSGETGSSDDVSWSRRASRQRVVTADDGLVNLGARDVDALSLVDLRQLDFSRTHDGSLELGDILGVRTSEGNYAKVQIVRTASVPGGAFVVRFVTYSG
jgi:hypothetical protein